jgi:hypothetical protein
VVFIAARADSKVVLLDLLSTFAQRVETSLEILPLEPYQT